MTPSGITKMICVSDNAILGIENAAENTGGFQIVNDADSDGISDSGDNCTLVANGPLIPDAGGNSQRDE